VETFVSDISAMMKIETKKKEDGNLELNHVSFKVVLIKKKVLTLIIIIL
jgi:hypothetical protein